MASILGEVKELRRDVERDFQKLYRRTYRIPAHAGLADVNLQQGDVLPDVATAEISSAQFSEHKIKDIGVGERLVDVEAFETVLWA